MPGGCPRTVRRTINRYEVARPLRGRAALFALDASTARRVALWLLPSHSARSRGIQEPRAQSVLQAFPDAATARSMTGWCAPHDGGEPRVLPFRAYRGSHYRLTCLQQAGNAEFTQPPREPGSALPGHLPAAGRGASWTMCSANIVNERCAKIFDKAHKNGVECDF